MTNYPSRRSPRLKDYDYRESGAYFVTICIHERQPILGKVEGDSVIRSTFGNIAQEEWSNIVVHRPTVDLDAFVVMPNHVHGIIVLSRDALETGQTNRASSVRTPPENRRKLMAGSLSAVVGGYKSAVTRRINALRETPGALVWQNRFHDYIIRNEADLKRIQEYVVYNPARWQQDVFFAAD